MVPATSTISWSILVDTISFLSNGTNKLASVGGGLASIDMYRSFTILSIIRCSQLNPHFTDSTIQVTDDVASQINSNTTGTQPISATAWSILCNASFAITLAFSASGVPLTMTERDTIVHNSDGACVGVLTGSAITIGKVGALFMRTVYTFVFNFPIITQLYIISDTSKSLFFQTIWCRQGSGWACV